MNTSSPTQHRIVAILTYLSLHFGICLLVFLCLQKPLFYFYNWNHGASAQDFGDWLSTYTHGFALDLATAGYLTAIPFLLLLPGLWMKQVNVLRSVLTVHNGLLALLLAAVILVDTALYEFWEFKLDKTILFYLSDPTGATASVTTGYIALRLLIFLLLASLLYYLLGLPLKLRIFRSPWRGSVVGAFVAWILAGGLLFASIRGLHIYPNTPGRVFYSKVNFLNHAALNPIFNLLYTVFNSENLENEFRFFPETERESLYAPLFARPDSTVTEPLLRTDRPNILYVVLEGFPAAFIENLGGRPEVGIHINRLSQEGVNFTQCYCSSFRTKRGIVAALSGYPGQPTTSIIRNIHKVSTLPGLPKSLRNHGYSTLMLYPSDITLYNFSPYFVYSGHDRTLSQEDFPPEDRTAAWGVPDHIGFDWLYNDIVQKHKAQVGPWYTTYLTVSSHTPFDVPYKRLEDKKLNAFAYTDSCFGAFVERIRQTQAWDNLLIVCTSDHGFLYGDMTMAEFFHVPFFLLGGAVKEPRCISTIVGQTDIPATILGQLGIAHEEFTFSRDVMSSGYTYPFAFTTFNNGFTFRDSTGCTVFDNVSGRATLGEDSLRIRKGKAFLQTLYDDLNSR
ncbi:MAG: LTA synthase family protein [Bacteroides sp.]|nr:LTA synthase family protein [Bacteroides sp.]